MIGSGESFLYTFHIIGSCSTKTIPNHRAEVMFWKNYASIKHEKKENTRKHCSYGGIRREKMALRTTFNISESVCENKGYFVIYM